METTKGHMNQKRKNLTSTNPNPKPLKVDGGALLRGKNVRGTYTIIYNARNIIFSKQTCQFRK